jgi:hypothetical protein
MAELERANSSCKIPSSSERAPHINEPAAVKYRLIFWSERVTHINKPTTL